MRTWLIALVFAGVFSLAPAATAATGRIVKVLPEFLDTQGRTSLSPSLYERDAYQATLRLHPERRSGLRFYVQWQTRGAVWERLTLRLELRGTVEGNLPKQLVIDKVLVNKGRRYSRWSDITLSSQEYKHLGTVTAWRASLWEGSKLLGQQQSFLW
jgi:hypothetical protein